MFSVRQQGGGPADRAEVEAAVLLARVRHGLRPVPLGDHDQRAAVRLEQVDVAVHPAGGRRSERARGQTLRRLGRAGVVDRVILQVLGACPSPRSSRSLICAWAMSRATMTVPVSLSGRGDRVAGELGEDLRHRPVQVDRDPVLCARDPRGSGRG